MKTAKIVLVLVFLAFVSCSDSSTDGESELCAIKNVGSINVSSSSVNSSFQIPPGDTTFISLKGTTAEFTGENVNIEQHSIYGTIVEIENDGIYSVKGSLNPGFIAVNKKGINPIIILNGVNITSPKYAALTCLKKSNIILVLEANSTNILTDGGQDATDGKYNLGYDTEEQPNATLLVRDDLTIVGSGKLIVNSNLNNGIGSRANLRIEGGDITVNNAPNNALKGNDGIIITGGTFNLVSSDDGIKSDETITINSGAFTISVGGDAISAEKSITINDGYIDIIESYEGLESYDINLNGGLVRIKAIDDGINVSGSTSTESAICTAWYCGGGGEKGKLGGVINGALTISGGQHRIEGNADGIDSNGDIVMNGGTVVVFSTSTRGGAIDAAGAFTLTGGMLIAAGADFGGQFKAPGNATQNMFLTNFSSISPCSLINVSSASGTKVATFTALSNTVALLVSSPELSAGGYTISQGGSHSGTPNALGLYEGGSYSGGAVVKNITLR